MNDELRAALDKLDAALAEARAAMEPEPEPATEPEPPCDEAGVPCPEPPHIIIVEDAPVGMAGTCRWEVADVKAVSASGRGSGVLATARAIGPFYTTDWQQVSFYTAMSPAAIRAACDEAGVPCPEPPTVVQRMIDACREGE